MDANQIESFLKALSCNPYVQGEWVRSSCPLAPFTHQKGTDSNPSFGMQPVIGGAKYNCFTCGGGTASQLLYILETYIDPNDGSNHRYDLVRARQVLDNGANNITELPDYDDRSMEKEVYEWSDWALDKWKSALNVPRAKQYLTGPNDTMFMGTQQKCRGLTVQEVIDFDFRYDPYGDRVVIPFYDQYGRLAGARGRSLTNKSFHDYTFHDHNNTDLVWCGEQCFQADEIVVIVEGQFDMVKTSRVYPHVIANLTALISRRKLEKLLDLSGVVFMLDNDKAGQDSTAKAVEYLAKKGVRVGIATYDGHDPDEASPLSIKRALEPFIHPSKLLI